VGTDLASRLSDALLGAMDTTLASRLSDALPDACTFSAPDPTAAPIAAPSSTFIESLGFHSLLPVLYFVNNVLTTLPARLHGSAAIRPNGSSAVLADGTIDLSAHPRYVLALGKVTPEGEPKWTTTLVTRAYITSLPVMQSIEAQTLIPLGNIFLGGRNGVLTSLQKDPTSDEMLDTLFANPGKHAASYMKRIRYTPPEIRTDLHRRALQLWENIQPEQRNTQNDIRVEPSPHADIGVWKKWLKTMREHPQSEGQFKFIGIPQVGPGYIKTHIEGTKAMALFIPANSKGVCNCRLLRDAILRSAAALFSVPQRYSHMLDKLELQVAEVRRTLQYDAARFGDENHLGLVHITQYLAFIGFTEDEAERLRPWAAAFLEMDLEEHPHSNHADELRAAKIHAHELIDADPNQVLKNVPADAPGYYNPRREQNRVTSSTRRTTETSAPLGNAPAGPSFITLDKDAQMNATDPENTVQLDYESDNNEDERMGPA